MAPTSPAASVPVGSMHSGGTSVCAPVPLGYQTLGLQGVVGAKCPILSMTHFPFTLFALLSPLLLSTQCFQLSTGCCKLVSPNARADFFLQLPFWKHHRHTLAGFVPLSIFAAARQAVIAVGGGTEPCPLLPWVPPQPRCAESSYCSRRPEVPLPSSLQAESSLVYWRGRGKSKLGKSSSSPGRVCGFDWHRCSRSQTLQPPPLSCVSSCVSSPLLTTPPSPHMGTRRQAGAHSWRLIEQICIPSSGRGVQPEAGEPFITQPG